MAGPPGAEGGSDPVPQDPAQIQRQIEDTRAELAHTIDAIADIVSPKRAARRGVDQLRGKVEELKAQLNGTPHRGEVGDLRAQRTGPPQRNGSSQQALPPGMSSQLEGSTLDRPKCRIR